MFNMKKFAEVAGAAALALSGLSCVAKADDAPAFAYTFNLGVTSDYRFRGISQRKEDPALQGGADFTYGQWYFGLWGSMINFGRDINDNNIADSELDIYGGYKHVWGPVTFDLGVIYYEYANSTNTVAGGIPGSNDTNYVEGKLGVSGNLTKDLALLATLYVSPDYTGETGTVETIEGTATYTLPKVWIFDPAISGRVGYQHGDDAAYKTLIANGSSDYVYWDAGITLNVEKFSFDFRYVDTNISNTGNFCTGSLLQCDANFVFTAKVTLP
jgi:uncharacterized protein (TIGR02001 family)